MRPALPPIFSAILFSNTRPEMSFSPLARRLACLGTLLAALVGLCAFHPAAAQTPTTTIQNDNGETRLQLNYDGGFVVPGKYLNGIAQADSIPASGPGTRLMWYPAKAAFRAGRVGWDSDKGDVWNADSIGTYSVAFGRDTKASGRDALAAGLATEATGPYTAAIGGGTLASGSHAVAMGLATSATGNAATATGSGTSASGYAATSLGLNTNAASYASLSLGEYNNANRSDDGSLFVVGNGVSGARSDALVLKDDGDLAIGSSYPQDLRMYVTKDKANAGVGDNPAANMVLFENTNTGTRPDVLGLKAGPTNPGSGVTYLSFYDRTGTTVGAIEGNGAGGVSYTSSGADFAEELPMAPGTAPASATDLVAVQGGTVSLDTKDAPRLMIVTDRPALTGNVQPAADEERVPVAFVGQVPVKVRGPASVGDLIVASGQDDGTARAVAPETYRRAKHGPIAGQAWSTKKTKKAEAVSAVVGLGQGDMVTERLQSQQREIETLRSRVQDLEALEDRLAQLESSSRGSLLAGWTGSGLLAALLALGLGLGAGLLWRGRVVARKDD